MLDDLLDGLLANIGWGRSIFHKRVQRLTLLQQFFGFVLSVCFWGSSVILLFWLTQSFWKNTSLWYIVPIAFIAFYLLWEIGIWFGLMLVEPFSKKTSK